MRKQLAVLLTVATSAASAQPGSFAATEPQAPSAFGRDPIVQITTTFRARIEGAADPREVPSPTAQDSARRMLYSMAANECTILAEYWKAECRLNSLYVSPAVAIEGGEHEAPSMFGTAVYELKLQASGR